MNGMNTNIFDLIKSDDLEQIRARIARLPEEINKTDGARRNPLHLAVMNNLFSVTEWILEKGADVRGQDVSGQTPLHYAARQNLWSITVLLLKHGADINASMEDGCAPLHLAAANGFHQVADLLLSHGCDVNPVDTIAGRTPLHYAVLSAGTDGTGFVELLLDKGASVDLAAKDGCTALHLAALRGHLEIARLLISRDANVNARDEAGQAPLHLAAAGWNPAKPDHRNAVIKMLIECGADLAAKNGKDLSPLEIALRYGNHEGAEIIKRRIDSS